MRFEIRKVGLKVWGITPTEGSMNGEQVAVVDGVTLKNVDLIGDFLIGKIEAMWGAVVDDKVYDDLELVAALRFNRAFKVHGSVNGGTVRRVMQDKHGWLEADSKHQVHTAGRAIVLGDTVCVSLKGT